MNLYYIYS